jgi:hypothetical protein
MNDDFLYTRQESPTPEFVAELHERLAQVDIPQKAKRKNIGRRYSWRGILAAAASLAAAITIFWTSPELHVPITNTILGNPNESVLRDFQEAVGFDYPQIPNGYYIGRIQASTLSPSSLVMQWRAYRGICTISMIVYEDPEITGVTVQQREYNHYLSETYAGIDIEVVGRDIEATWRLTTHYNRPNTMTLDWQIGKVIYVLETLEQCFSRAEFSTIAQSIVPDSP